MVPVPSVRKMDEITVRCSFLEVKFCLLEFERERFDCDPSKYLHTEFFKLPKHSQLDEVLSHTTAE